MLDGTKIKFLRYTMGRTQKQIADWCGVSERYIKYIERNDMQPSEELYNNIIKAIYQIGKPVPKKKKSGDTNGTAQ